MRASNKGLKVYLAIPYTGLESKSVDAANNVAACLLKHGVHVFSPITYTHALSLKHCLPGDWRFWEDFDTTFISWADELWVVCIDGWELSVGVRQEIQIARHLGKTIRMISAEAGEQEELTCLTEMR